ncbi:unnamed protein product [Amoebophrya sp. A120]|nr:unnamed protein product [Amoebophrya sp. A120]|eukprot:GSA120T00000958001.1
MHSILVKKMCRLFCYLGSTSLLAAYYPWCGWFLRPVLGVVVDQELLHEKFYVQVPILESKVSVHGGQIKGPLSFDWPCEFLPLLPDMNAKIRAENLLYKQLNPDNEPDKFSIADAEFMFSTSTTSDSEGQQGTTTRTASFRLRETRCFYQGDVVYLPYAAPGVGHADATQPDQLHTGEVYRKVGREAERDTEPLSTGAKIAAARRAEKFCDGDAAPCSFLGDVGAQIERVEGSSARKALELYLGTRIVRNGRGTFTMETRTYRSDGTEYIERTRYEGKWWNDRPQDKEGKLEVETFEVPVEQAPRRSLGRTVTTANWQNGWPLDARLSMINGVHDDLDVIVTLGKRVGEVSIKGASGRGEINIPPLATSSASAPPPAQGGTMILHHRFLHALDFVPCPVETCRRTFWGDDGAAAQHRIYTVYAPVDHHFGRGPEGAVHFAHVKWWNHDYTAGAAMGQETVAKAKQPLSGQYFGEMILHNPKEPKVEEDLVPDGLGWLQYQVPVKEVDERGRAVSVVQQHEVEGIFSEGDLSRGDWRILPDSRSRSGYGYNRNRERYFYQGGLTMSSNKAPWIFASLRAAQPRGAGAVLEYKYSEKGVMYISRAIVSANWGQPNYETGQMFNVAAPGSRRGAVREVHQQAEILNLVPYEIRVTSELYAYPKDNPIPGISETKWVMQNAFQPFQVPRTATEHNTLYFRKWHWRDGDFQEIEGAANIARPSKGTPMIFFAAAAEAGDEISIIAKRTYAPAASDPKKQQLHAHKNAIRGFHPLRNLDAQRLEAAGDDDDDFALSNLAYTFANLHRLRADRPLAKAVAEAERLQVDLAEIQKVFLHTKGLVLEEKESFYTEPHRSAVTLVDVLTPQWQADMLVAPGYMGRLEKQGTGTSYLYGRVTTETGDALEGFALQRKYTASEWAPTLPPVLVAGQEAPWGTAAAGMPGGGDDIHKMNYFATAVERATEKFFPGDGAAWQQQEKHKHTVVGQFVLRNFNLGPLISSLHAIPCFQTFHQPPPAGSSPRSSAVEPIVECRMVEGVADSRRLAIYGEDEKGGGQKFRTLRGSYEKIKMLTSLGSSPTNLIASDFLGGTSNTLDFDFRKILLDHGRGAVPLPSELDEQGQIKAQKALLRKYKLWNKYQQFIRRRDDHLHEADEEFYMVGDHLFTREGCPGCTEDVRQKLLQSVFAVRDQENTGTCYAYAAASVATIYRSLHYARDRAERAQLLETTGASAVSFPADLQRLSTNLDRNRRTSGVAYYVNGKMSEDETVMSPGSWWKNDVRVEPAVVPGEQIQISDEEPLKWDLREGGRIDVPLLRLFGGFRYLEKEADVKHHLRHFGPVMVVYDDVRTNPFSGETMSHAMAVVGYFEEKVPGPDGNTVTKTGWILKNSWATNPWFFTLGDPDFEKFFDPEPERKPAKPYFLAPTMVPPMKFVVDPKEIRSPASHQEIVSKETALLESTGLSTLSPLHPLRTDTAEVDGNKPPIDLTRLPPMPLFAGSSRPRPKKLANKALPSAASSPVSRTMVSQPLVKEPAERSPPAEQKSAQSRKNSERTRRRTTRRRSRSRRATSAPASRQTKPGPHLSLRHQPTGRKGRNRSRSTSTAPGTAERVPTGEDAHHGQDRPRGRSRGRTSSREGTRNGDRRDREPRP